MVGRGADSGALGSRLGALWVSALWCDLAEGFVVRSPTGTRVDVCLWVEVSRFGTAWDHARREERSRSRIRGRGRGRGQGWSHGRGEVRGRNEDVVVDRLVGAESTCSTGHALRTVVGSACTPCARAADCTLWIGLVVRPPVACVHQRCTRDLLEHYVETRLLPVRWGRGV